MKTITNKLTTLLIISFNFLLICQESTEKSIHTKPIQLTPLYSPNISQPVREEEKKGTPKQDPQQTQKMPLNRSKPIPEWILESAIENAPELLKGIIAYLQACLELADTPYHFINVPSFHRFILVGPPGSGKTTMAHAIAHEIEYPTIVIGATSFLGHFRNETAKNIDHFFRKYVMDEQKKVVIIDELNKLFEHHKNKHSDDSQTAASFWLVLDKIEKAYPNVIIIATANNIDKLPPEIKSRFSGKIINMPLPTKKQQITAFKEHIANDESIILDKSVNDAFIAKIINYLHTGSLRDIQLIIDTAKMFYCAENSSYCLNCEWAYFNELPIVLNSSHFQHALDQLQKESTALEGKFIDQLHKKLEYWGPMISAIANLCVFIRTPFDIARIFSLQQG